MAISDYEVRLLTSVYGVGRAEAVALGAVLNAIEAGPVPESVSLTARRAVVQLAGRGYSTVEAARLLYAIDNIVAGTPDAEQDPRVVNLLLKRLKIGAALSESALLTAMYTEPALAQTSVYPLSDDGAAATVFGMGHAAATAPGYQTVSYTYTDAQPNGLALALPALANLGAQTIAVAADEILAMEAVVNSAPAMFEGIGLYAQVLHNGTPVGQGFIRLGDSDGSTPVINYQGSADIVRSAAAAGFRLGLEFNGATGTFTFRTTDGLAGTVAVPGFTAGDGLLFSIGIDDGAGTPVNLGNTCSVTLVSAAVDMVLSYTAGAIDVGGVAL